MAPAGFPWIARCGYPEGFSYPGFRTLCARPTFEPAFVRWMPAELAAEMRDNGRHSWPQIQALLDL